MKRFTCRGKIKQLYDRATVQFTHRPKPDHYYVLQLWLNDECRKEVPLADVDGRALVTHGDEEAIEDEVASYHVDLAAALDRVGDIDKLFVPGQEYEHSICSASRELAIQQLTQQYWFVDWFFETLLEN